MTVERARTFLCCALVALAAWGGWLSPSAMAEGARTEITAPEAYDQASKNKRLLIDVRSPGEWRQTGVPKNAHAITIHRQGGLDAFLTDVERLTGCDKSKPIALICASGVRSARAMAYLRSRGYTNVRNVTEGMIGHGPFGDAEKRGWLKRGLPTQPCGRC